MNFILFLLYADTNSLACPFYTLLAIGHCRFDIISHRLDPLNSLPDSGDSSGWYT